MGILETLFNSSKTIDKATDAIINTGDALFYTEEERADYKKEQRQFFPTLLNAYAPFKIAQRVLAIWFSLLFGISFIVGLTMEIFNIVIKYQALRDKLEVPTLLDTTPLVNLVSAFSLATIVMLIVSFYFAGGVVDSFKRGDTK